MSTDSRTFLVNNSYTDTDPPDYMVNPSDPSFGKQFKSPLDLTITLPNSIFSGTIKAINLVSFECDLEIDTFGHSNNTFSIRYLEQEKTIILSPDYEIYSAIDIAYALENAINFELGTTAFVVLVPGLMFAETGINHTNTISAIQFVIRNTEHIRFDLIFDVPNSIGPLLGFGTMTYTNNVEHIGGNIPDFSLYKTLIIRNSAATDFPSFNIESDINCKMDLYDKEGNQIPNHFDECDATISMPITDGEIHNPQEICIYIQGQINEYYTSYWEESPTFTVTFDIHTFKFTITNDKEVKFGIGFRFFKPHLELTRQNQYGSLHKVLGFEKKIYLNYTSITSIRPAGIFENSFVGETLFICSDLISQNFDASIGLVQSKGQMILKESLFSIPMKSLENRQLYKPQSENEHRVRIHSSRLAKLYNENDTTNEKQISFSLQLASGRHITLDSQWAMKFAIEY